MQELPHPVNVSSDSGLEGEVISRDSSKKHNYKNFVRMEEVSMKHGKCTQVACIENPPQPDTLPPVCQQRIKRKGNKAGQIEMQPTCEKTISRGLAELSLSTCVKQDHIPHKDKLCSSSYGSSIK